MSQLGWSNAVSLIPLLAGFTFGSVVMNTYVCLGNSTKLFESSIQINKSDTIMFLYKNDDKHGHIAEFNSTSYIIYQDNIVMDKNKYLWILNVHITDQGRYILQTDLAHEDTSNITTYLYVWVAPDPSCKPVIKRIGKILTARLPNASCGTPVVSAYFRDCSGIIGEDTDIRTLQVGREGGTYHACISGPALSCARSLDPSSDYCYSFQIEKSSDCGKDDLHKWQYAIFSLQCAIFVAVIIFGTHGWYAYNKLRSTTENQKLQEEKQQGKIDEQQQQGEQQLQEDKRQIQEQLQPQRRNKNGRYYSPSRKSKGATRPSGNPKRNLNDKDSPGQEMKNLMDDSSSKLKK